MIRSLILTLIMIFSFQGIVQAHCQIPCGIYDDPLRVKLIREHFQTVEKSMKMIKELSSADEKDFNQLVRWVNNKDEHADKISDIVTYYFMAQRIHLPDEKHPGEAEEYTEMLTALHEILFYSMKMKQTTDLDYIEKARASLDSFEDIYFHEELSH